MTRTETSHTAASLILRIGLALVFAYAALDAFHEPLAWTSFIPSWATFGLSAQFVLDAFSLIQLLVAAALLWRPLAAYAALVGIALLLGISLVNLDALLVVFRDFGLAFMAAGIVALEWK